VAKQNKNVHVILLQGGIGTEQIDSRPMFVQ